MKEDEVLSFRRFCALSLLVRDVVNDAFKRRQSRAVLIQVVLGNCTCGGFLLEAVGDVEQLLVLVSPATKVAPLGAPSSETPAGTVSSGYPAVAGTSTPSLS